MSTDTDLRLEPEGVLLSSDFLEPYDHHFGCRHRRGLVNWDRTSTTRRTRAEDHAILRAADARHRQAERQRLLGDAL